MRRILFFLILTCLSIGVYGQQIGDWTIYQPYGALKQVENVGKEVFALAGTSLFSFHKGDGYITEFHKNKGISDANIQLIGYDKSCNTLVLIYKNQNIDLLVDGVVYNIPDFKDKIMTVDKNVNGLYVNKGKAYLSTAFGIVVLDLFRKEIVDTYNIGINVKMAFEAYEHICAVTDKGIRACPITLNGYDNANWSHVSNAIFVDAAIFDGYFYGLGTDQSLYKVNPNWSVEHLRQQHLYDAIRADDDRLYLINNTFVDLYNPKKGEDLRISNLSGAKDMVAGETNEFWVACDTGLKGLKRNQHDFTSINENILPNGPIVSEPYNMDLKHGNIYLSSGGPFRTFDHATIGQVSVLSEGKWLNIDRQTIESSAEANFVKLMDIKASETDPSVFYVSSFSNGVFEFKDGQLSKIYTNKNGEIESIPESDTHFWASAMDFDPSGNLWVLNSKVNNSLRVKTAEGKWYKYSIPSLGIVEDLYPLLVTRKGRSAQKWFLSYLFDLCLVVFDENGTFNDASDDRSVVHRALTDQDGVFYNNIQFRSLLEDNDGRIWVGTSIGPLIINNPEGIFESGGRCTRLKVPRNDGTGLADYLLDNVNIMCMAVDAANRKWIGTSGNGVYLLSEDGMETIHHFTSENSSLPSNEVLSMKIDHQTGKVYIGCIGGLVSYQSDAVVGKESFSNVYAYPNPVNPDYSGLITVTGLMSNTLVKVTDINNNLIYQSYSLGGQFTWDGLNKKGDKVKSGVYLVYGSADDGKKGMVTKILIVR